MKLKEFNAENCARLMPVGVASVSVSRKSGLFSFSRAAAVMMGIQEGDKLAVVQDEESPKDWYFKKSDTGFCTRPLKGHGGIGAAFGSTRVAHALLDSAKHTYETLAMATFLIKPVEIEKETYWLILTVKPIREKAV